MDAVTRGQVSGSAAEVYETFFVPALFAEWAPRIADAAGLRPGGSVLDIACGTGVLAREALARVSPGGTVVGLDRNEDMLAVARRIAPGIDWRSGLAEALPFPDASFDAVISQFGLMFFDDRPAALAEMFRVLAPGGTLAVAVWGALEETPGYAAMADLLQRLFGTDTANAIRAPYALGDRASLSALFSEAGIPGARLETLRGTARFPSLDGWVHTDVKGWTLADMIDEVQYETLRSEAAGALAQFVGGDGTVSFDHGAHVVTAVKH